MRKSYVSTRTPSGACFGFALEAVPTAFIRPYRIRENTLAKQIEKIMEAEIHEKLKKDIMNVAIGWLGKKWNTKETFGLFRHEKDAYLAANDEWHLLPGTDLWVAKSTAQAELSEGFLPLHKMVYDSVNKHVRDFSRELEAKGISVLGCHGDSVFVTPEDAAKLDYPLEYACTMETMGRIKKEPGKKLSKMKLLKPDKKCGFKVQPLPQTVKHTMVDEYDAVEAAALFELESEPTPLYDLDDRICGHADLGKPYNWLVTGDDAGSGKTFTVLKYVTDYSPLYSFFEPDRKPYYTVACFSNEQALDLRMDGYNAETLYGLCGGRPDAEFEGRAGCKYWFVVVDELGMFGVPTRDMFEQYKRRNPGTQYFATEDLEQIPPIEEDFTGGRDFYRTASASMFSHELHLKVPKRYTSAERAAQVQALKAELAVFSKKQRIPPTDLAKLLPNFATITNFNPAHWWSENSVCISYYHETRRKVNSLVHKHLGFDEYYVCGLHYIAGKRPPHAKMHTNFRYELVSKSSDKYTFKCVFYGTIFEVPVAKVTEFTMSLPYCRTGHSIQGRTVKGNVIVFDAFGKNSHPPWLYVALTRSKNIGCTYAVGNSQPTLDCSEVNHYLKGYKQQDEQRGHVSDQFFTVEGVLKLSQKQFHLCACCREPMNFQNKPGDPNNWSLDRLDDSQGHVLGNCQLSCLQCNISKNDLR